MDEIDLIRRALAGRYRLPEDAESQQQRQARLRLTAVIADERVTPGSLRSRVFGRGIRRTVTVVVGLLILPSGYAIAEVTDLFHDGAITRSECEKMPELNQQPVVPGDASRLSCADLREAAPSSGPEIRRIGP